MSVCLCPCVCPSPPFFHLVFFHLRGPCLPFLASRRSVREAECAFVQASISDFVAWQATFPTFLQSACFTLPNLPYAPSLVLDTPTRTQTCSSPCSHSPRQLVRRPWKGEGQWDRAHEGLSLHSGCLVFHSKKNAKRTVIVNDCVSRNCLRRRRKSD